METMSRIVRLALKKPTCMNQQKFEFLSYQIVFRGPDGMGSEWIGSDCRKCVGRVGLDCFQTGPGWNLCSALIHQFFVSLSVNQSFSGEPFI